MLAPLMPPLLLSLLLAMLFHDGATWLRSGVDGRFMSMMCLLDEHYVFSVNSIMRVSWMRVHALIVWAIKRIADGMGVVP